MSRRRRRRPGRFRRWLLRPMFWALAAAALLVLAAALVLRSSWIRERAAAELEARGSQLLGRAVTVESVRFGVLPVAVEVEGLEVAGREPAEAPLAAVRHATVEADVTFAWTRGLRLALRSVRIQDPVLTLILEDGSSNLPRWSRRGRRAARSRAVEVALGELQVSGATLVIQKRRLPLDLEARAVEARLWGRDASQWRAAAQEVEVTLPRARPYLGAVDLRGRLDDGAIELLIGRVSGPELRAAATGRLAFGVNRRGALEIEAETDAALLRRLGYLEDQLAGELTFGGGLFWDTDGWNAQGIVESSALAAFGFPLRGLRGVVTGDRERWQLDIQRAGYADGRLGGSILVELAPERRVDLDLTLEQVDLQRLLDDRGIPVAGVAAAASGVFKYGFDWRRPRSGDGWADLTVAPADKTGLQFGGTVPLVIEGGLVRATAARLDSANQRLQSSGSYDLDRRRGAFRFRILSERVEELLPLLELDEAARDALWAPNAGTGEIAGEFRLTPSGPSADLRLDLAGVRSAGASAEQLQGSLAVERAGIRRMRLELLRPDAGLIVTGSLPFSADDESSWPFAIGVDAAGWPLGEARVWLPFELPVEGPVFGALRLGGRLADPEGSVSVTVQPGTLYGLPADELRAELRFDPLTVSFDELLLSAPAGSLRAAGRWDRQSDDLSLALESDGLDLRREPFTSWWTGSLGGSLTLAGTVGGTLAAPRLDGRLAGTDLALGEVDLGRAGEARLDVDWRDGRLDLSGSLLGLVEVGGGGVLGWDEVDLDLAVAAPDLAALARLFGLLEELEFAGSGEGRLLVGGRPGGQESWRTALGLDRLELSYGHHRLTNLDPVELSWEPAGLRLDSVYLAEPGTENDLFVTGRVDLVNEGELDLRVQGGLDPALVGLLLPGFELRGGRFDLLATVRGTVRAPLINGQGEVRDSQLLLGELPQSLDRVVGVVLFYPGRLVLDGVRGDFAGGRVLIGGSVQLPSEGKELTYRLQGSGSGLTLRYPEGWELRGDAEVTVASVDEGRQVRGAVNLERALYLRRVQVGLTQLLQAMFQRRRQEVEVTDEMLASTQLNLLISGRDALRVRNNVANLRGDVDLALRGSLARPVLFGRIELTPGGILQVGGSDYTVERGFLSFANPYRMEPVIDLAAITRRRDYDLSLSLSGTLDRLNASLSSDPPLADLDVLGLLATGEPTRAKTPAVGAEAFLYGQAASLVTERVNRLFGLDRLRIDPLTGSSGSLSSARVTVGKQLSRDLLATYSYDPSQTEQQILQLEWSVSRGLVLVVTQNGDGTYAVDARWEKGF